MKAEAVCSTKYWIFNTVHAALCTISETYENNKSSLQLKKKLHQLIKQIMEKYVQ